MWRFISRVRLNVGLPTVALAMSALLISCESSKQPAPTPASTAIASPTKHWIQDQRLRQVMAELSKSIPSWPKTLPQEPESSAVASNAAGFDEVATLATSLAEASTHIPDLAPNLKMNEADRRGFLATAMTLHDEALQLHDAASGHRIEQMQRSMDAINSTCISCHSRYRDFSGALDSRRAALDRSPDRATALSTNETAADSAF